MDSTDTKSTIPEGESGRELFQEALEKLRPGFQADGMDLKIGAIYPTGTVEVRVVMGSHACEECLLPPETLAKMFLAAMRRVRSSVSQVYVSVDRTAED
ncbi:MAG: hypothetical protein ACRD10_10550 [Terriglobia bacterium]